MGYLGELLASDHRRTLEFFVMRLADVSGPEVNKRELLYSASVLAHYAQTSTACQTGIVTPVNLSSVFDQFIADTSMLNDVLMIETAGAQCLLLSGFFEKQMSSRHNIGWYAKLGSGFFHRASRFEKSGDKVRIMSGMAANFEFWRSRCARVGHECANSPYILPSARRV